MQKMTTTPSDIMVSGLLGVKLKELHFWVKQANTLAGRRVLTQKGTVQDLCKKIAAHYSLDLTATPKTEVIVGLSSMDLQLHLKQWVYLRSLGEEWEAAAAAGLLFKLLPGEFPSVSRCDVMCMHSDPCLARPAKRHDS
jgi:hypothetical protein